MVQPPASYPRAAGRLRPAVFSRFRPALKSAGPAFYSGPHFINAEHAAGKSFADELSRERLIVLFKERHFIRIEITQGILNSIGSIRKRTEKFRCGCFHAQDNEPRARRFKVRQTNVCGSMDADQPLERQKRVGPEPREKRPEAAAQINKRSCRHARMLRQASCLCESFSRIGHEVWIIRV